MKIVLIVGMGASGKVVYKNAITNGMLPIFYDDKILGSVDLQKIICFIDFVVVSPAINNSHIIFSMAKKHKIPIFGEIEFAYLYGLRRKNILGVTGTNGKTTVCTMLHTILKEKFDLAGNVGTPATDMISSKNSGIILELSSFQLMTIQNFHPHIAVLLNIKPDHIDFHKTFKNYKQSKLNIVKNMTAGDFVIINEDDRNLKKLKTLARVLTFSKKNKFADCYFNGKKIFINENKTTIYTLDVSVFGKILEHNIENIMAVILAIKCLNLSYSKAVSRLLSYSYQPFRMAYIGNICNKDIYNDSKSTNVASTISALNGLKKEKSICLILGGRYKKESFRDVFKNFKNLELVLVFGESRFEIEKYANEVGFKNIIILGSLKDVVDNAFASNCKVILFSPACASFDMFSGFLERGEQFNKLVNEYKSKSFSLGEIKLLNNSHN